MPRKLKDIMLDEVSGVDVPADPNAKITLFKRGGEMDDMTEAQKAKMKEYMDKGMSEEDARKACMRETTKGGDMDPQELAKKLEALEGQVADLTKRAEGAEAERDALRKAADEAGFDVSDDNVLTKRAEIEYIEIEGERLEKSAVPAAVLKALEAKDAELAKAKKHEEETALAKRGAAELPHLRGTDLAKGKLLDMIDDDEIIAALKAADEALKKQFQEIGNNPMNDEASATFRLNKMAKDYAAEKGVQFETAFAEVTKTAEGRDLMVQSRAEAN